MIKFMQTILDKEMSLWQCILLLNFCLIFHCELIKRLTLCYHQEMSKNMIDATKKQMTVAATIYLFILGDATESDQTYNSGSSK